jgi:hypothetical protein
MRVFIGLTDIASQISQYKNGFENNNISTFVGVHHIGSIRNQREVYDFIIEKPNGQGKKSLLNRGVNKIYRSFNKKRIWKKALKECDLFIFFWSSFQHDYQDISKLKKLNKKVIVIFVGSDIRWKRAMEQEFRLFNLDPIEYSKYDSSAQTLTKKLNFLRTAEKYADIIYSIPNQSQLSLRPYLLFKYPINLNDYKEKINQKQVCPIVVHAPTSPDFKGTKYALSTFEKLKREGLNFQVKLLQNIPFRDILDEYSNADILVGQLLAPGGGKQEREALASGTVVLSNMSYSVYEQKTPKNCPIIDVNKDTLYFELKEMILNNSKREFIAAKGRKWVEDNYNVDNLVLEIIDDLQNESKAYDFVPTFLREKYIPENYEINTLNYFNNFVKDTSWYKQYVPSGEREGLIF